MNYQNIEIKQHSQVTHQGCVMDQTMSWELNVLKIINKKWKILYRKKMF